MMAQLVVPRWSIPKTIFFLVISIIVAAFILVFYTAYNYRVALATWPRIYQKMQAGEVLKYEDKLWTCITAVNGSYFQSEYVPLDGHKLHDEFLIPDFSMKITHVYTCAE